jgi:diacylglycerol kinase (ATP)
LKVLVILNGVSRKKKLFYSSIRDALVAKVNPVIWQTEYAGHAEALALKGAQEQFELIISAGGDGTMHQIVNGVCKYDRARKPLIGLIPLGSGNDLARSLGASTDPQQILSSLERRPRSIDIGLAKAIDADGQHVSRYFINECSMGMGPEVVRRVNKGGGRGLTAGLMYTQSIVATFFTLKPAEIEVKADKLHWKGKSRVLAVANGKTFGHGIYIAPNAKMDDGKLNMFLAANPSLPRFILLLQNLRKPAESKDACLTYWPTSRVEVTSDRPLPVEADGELVGFTRLVCEISKEKLSFLV